MCGSHYLTLDYKNKLKENNFYFDDVGNSVSELNPWLGDLTGLYWIWKNTDDEIVGTNQYRRPWVEEDIHNLKFDKNTLYISAPYKLEENVYDQYKNAHGEIGMNILYEASWRKKIPFTHNDLNVLKNFYYLSACNMFFADRELFNKVCSVLFEIVFELYDGVKYALPFIQYDNPAKVRETRMIAFLSERILTLMYLNPKYYFGNIEVQDVGWKNL